MESSFSDSVLLRGLIYYLLHMSELTLESWQRMTPHDRDAAARKIALQLPTGCFYQGIARYKLNGIAHDVAEFFLGSSKFVLIPGGRVTIGYDASRPWQATAEEKETWTGTAECYGFDESIEEHIAQVTLRPRDVEIRPMLIDTEAREIGWEPLPADCDEVQAIVREHLKGKQVGGIELVAGGKRTRVRRSPDGQITAERFRKEMTHELLTRELAEAGFRLPISDEWEFVCGAGAATLFRWGDHAPCDRYPTDRKLKQPAFEQHRQPNAFGLSIAFDPYKFEVVAEPNIARGGDGGVCICGGAGFFIGWLTLATAYFEPELSEPQELSPGYAVARRVLSLT